MVKKVPKHVALIPDGNRRWARERGMKGTEGYKISGSFERLFSLFREGEKLGIEYFTLWVFSTDNWKRNPKEIDKLFDLFRKRFVQLEEEVKKGGLRFRHFGRKDRLPKDILKSIEKLEKFSEGNKGQGVQLCLDYGGRDEIVRVVNKLLKSGVSEIDEKDFGEELDSAGIPDVDLIIRTSGERRLSGFMPFQSVYAELFFSEKYYPDFGPADLREAVENFGERKRRFGKG